MITKINIFGTHMKSGKTKIRICIRDTTYSQVKINKKRKSGYEESKPTVTLCAVRTNCKVTLDFKGYN